MNIRCQQLGKAYGSQPVLRDFSVDFGDTGFYLLLGESGSGKTTLLNLLAGFLPFGAGSITWGRERFTGQVDTARVEQHFDYITQDTFFADFLSARDNLRLVSGDDAAVSRWLERFGLTEQGEQKVTTLSGGEKQRLAIIRSMLKGKRVLFLDEPTAALDEENKRRVFAMLRELSREVLILCASHDPQATEYADLILRFEKPVPGETAIPPEPAPAKVSLAECGGKTAGLRRFLGQWFRSKAYNRRAQGLFTLFLSLCLCLCMAVDTPQGKLESSMEHLYGVNMLTLETLGSTPWEAIDPGDPTVREVVIDYGTSMPDHLAASLDMDIHPLATHPEHTRLSRSLRYGTWFTSWDQAILSWEMASGLAEDPESLIGTHISSRLYGLGSTQLEVVGILAPLRDDEKAYLEALGVVVQSGERYNPVNYRGLYFVSGELVDRLVDDAFYAVGSGYRRTHHLYFDSYREMKAFYDRNLEAFEARDIHMHYDWLSNLAPLLVFETLYRLYLPLAVCLVLFATVFYILLIKTEFVYNNRFIAVFAYAGYAKDRVIRCFIGLHLWQLVKAFLAALGIALALTAGGNWLNGRYLFVNFRIFSYNPLILGLTLAVMLGLSLGMMNLVFRRVRVKSWYESLIAGRDLI